MTLVSFGGSSQQTGFAGILSSALLSNGQSLLETFNAAGLVSYPLGLVWPAVVIAAGSMAARDLPIGWGDSGQGFARLGDLRNRPDYELLRIAVFGGGSPGKGTDPGIGTDWFDSVIVLVMPEPSAYAAPGDAVYQAAAGTLGYRVTWPRFAGFLTAGHVVAVGSGPVRENRPPQNPVVGNVHLSLDPAGQGALPCADVAIVATGGANHVAPSFAPVALTPLEAVNFNVRSGAGDQVRAFMQFYYSKVIQGTWGDCYMTSSGVSIPGDSGAEVRTTYGAPAATVVGGTPGVFDLVQDVGYQMRMTGISGLILT